MILVRPREEGNIGSVARAMANMGLENLILVEPAPPLGGVAKGFGVGGWHILEGIRREPDLSSALAPFHRAIGTSSSRARNLREHRLLTPRDLPQLLAEDPPEARTAMVFGPEDKGLTRQELGLCGSLVHIPTAEEHPTLNLAQAVLVLAYELWIGLGKTSRDIERKDDDPRGILASSADLDRLANDAGRVLASGGYPEGREISSLVDELRRLAARWELSIREVRMLRKICRRLIAALPIASVQRDIDRGKHSN